MARVWLRSALVDNRPAFPKLMHVETATVSEKVTIDQLKKQIVPN